MSGGRINRKFQMPKSTHVEIKSMKLYMTTFTSKSQKIKGRNKGLEFIGIFHDRNSSEYSIFQ